MDKLILTRGSRVLAPSLFTVGNMACGFYSLLAAHRGEFTTAASAILGGILFDSLDGRVARLVHGESSFGVEFDSLSDFLTFGVAPAYMMYAFILKDYGAWAYPIAFLFAMCGALRLARFNAVAHETGGSKTHFMGLPIPAGAGFLASYVLIYQIVEEGRPAKTFGPLMREVPLLYGFAPAMMAVIAFLMVSTIPYKKGSLPAAESENERPGAILPPRAIKNLLVLTLVGSAIYLYPQNAIFLIFFLYVISGPLTLLARRVMPTSGGKAEAPYESWPKARPGPPRR